MRRLAPLLVLLPLGASAAAQEPPALEKLFPLEAPIESEAPGLVRLVLPPDVLAEARPDLSDVRVFDAAGAEVPFLLDAARRDEAVVVRARFEGAVLSVQRDRAKNATADRPGDATERYEIEAPPGPPEGEVWELVVSPTAPRFVREVSVTALGDGGERPLVDGASVFRLDPGTERVRIPLPPFDAPRLRVEIGGSEPFYLEPRFRFQSARRIDAERRSVVPLAEISRESGGGRTVLELERPRGLVPDRLRLETSTGVFDRGVAVWDEQPGRGERRLGTARLFRVRAGVEAEALQVPLAPASGTTLRVEIVDGDSPALADLRFAAVVNRPALVFELRGAPRGTLRFGGGRAHGPRYDLRALRVGRATVTGERAEAAALLHDDLPAARLGPTRPNRAFDATPALAFAMHPGAAIDPRRFGYRRPVSIRPSAEGLSRLRLAPADAAHARPDFADVRVVDARARQWPYLLVRRAASVGVPLARTRSSERHVTTLRLAPPAAPLLLDRVELRSQVPFFDRAFRLAALDADGHERQIAHGRLAKQARRPRPPRIAFPPQRVHGLVLRIEDGDDAPLAFTEATARAWVPDLFLVAPAGSYALLVGAPDASPARYELERVRDVVLAVAAAEAQAGPLEANPDFRLAARLAGEDGPAPLLQNLLVWGALLAAVAILGVLTWRIARQEPGSAD